MAFLGRYGHQPADEIMRMPMRDIMSLAHGVGELIKEEAEATERAADKHG